MPETFKWVSVTFQEFSGIFFKGILETFQRFSGNSGVGFQRFSRSFRNGPGDFSGIQGYFKRRLAIPECLGA